MASKAKPAKYEPPRDPRVSTKKGFIPGRKENVPEGQLNTESVNAKPPSVRFTDDLKTCIGCGAGLQTENSLQLGYVPPHKYLAYESWRQAVSQSVGASGNSNASSDITDFVLDDLTTDDAAPPAPTGISLPSAVPTMPIDPKKPMRLTCQRCYELEHYGHVTPAAVDASHFADALSPLKDAEALVVNVVDIFDFHGSFIPKLRKHSGTNPIIVAANKVDLLPDGVHVERVKQWLHKETFTMGVTVVSVQLFSAKTGQGIEELASAINWYRAGRSEVFVVGCANVGKSTLINKLMQVMKGPRNRKVTVSPIPGTTLGLIRLPLGDDAWLLDTPGIFSDRQIVQYLSAEELKKVSPQKKLKPVVERLNPGRTIFIAGLARVDYTNGPDGIFFTFFTSNEIYLHKTHTSRAEELYNAKRGSMLDPPSFSNKKLPELVPHHFELVNNAVRGIFLFSSER